MNYMEGEEGEWPLIVRHEESAIKHRMYKTRLNVLERK